MEAQEKPDVLSEEIKNMSAKQVAERMSEMRKILLTLEWDKNHNQIHVGMEEKYNKLKEEYASLENQLNELKTLEKEQEKTPLQPKVESREELIPS